MNDKEVVDLLISIKNYFQNDAISWALDRAIWAIKSIESIMAERDAAVKDLKAVSNILYIPCKYCKYHEEWDFLLSKEPCASCNYEKNWEWRGIDG